MTDTEQANKPDAVVPPATNVVVFPKWKSKETSPAERFSELVGLAITHPEKFKRCVIVWQYEDEAGTVRTDYVPTAGTRTTDCINMFELAKFMCIDGNFKG